MVRSIRHRFQLRILVCLGAIICLAAVIDTPLLAFYRISGNSMRPSYYDGDRVLVTTLGEIEVGDAIIARLGGETLIKRVVAGPGDRVALYHGRLFRNGEACDPVPETFLDHTSEQPFELGREQYYLLGDNRRVSVDSRIFGPVTRDDIVGTVVYRWFEASDSGSVAAARD